MYGGRVTFSARVAMAATTIATAVSCSGGSTGTPGTTGTSPTIATFTATPISIISGQSGALTWTVSDATTLSIDHGIGVVTGASTPVSPAITTTYTLTATNATGSTTAHVTLTVVAAVPVPVPASGAYFGAWANPTSTGTVEANAEALESQIGRTLRLHMHYYAWGNGTTPTFPDAAMQSDVTAGRIPVVTWGCSDVNAIVIAGTDDSLLINTANAVKQFGSSIFIRWYWEMNLGSNQTCMGSGGAASYIAAWQHIYNVFKAQGVTNVSWLWNPGGTSRDPDATPYYPGDGFVDWIGFDGYDKVAANDFGLIYGSFYQMFSSHGKPMLIGETGECASVQATYLALAQAELESKSNPGGYAFPLVKGFMYFDAPGQFANCTWNFGSAGTTAFAAMGADSYFQAKP
jgi:hypothetical protein